MHSLIYKTAALLCCMLGGLILASCSKPSPQYSVDGVKGKFCVPRGYPPQGVWFVPKDGPNTPHGFSFMGCKLLDGAARESCTLPDGLISVSVMPLSVKVNQLWGELKGAAIYHEVISDSAVKYETDSKTGMLVTYNEKVWPTWFVWKEAGDKVSEPKNILHDSDELISSCSSSKAFPGGSGGIGRPDDFTCERYVKGPAYALKYQFVTKERVPNQAQLELFEGALFRQVDRWQCQE